MTREDLGLHPCQQEDAPPSGLQAPRRGVSLLGQPAWFSGILTHDDFMEASFRATASYGNPARNLLARVAVGDT